MEVGGVEDVTLRIVREDGETNARIELCKSDWSQQAQNISTYMTTHRSNAVDCCK